MSACNLKGREAYLQYDIVVGFQWEYGQYCYFIIKYILSLSFIRFICRFFKISRLFFSECSSGKIWRIPSTFLIILRLLFKENVHQGNTFHKL